MGCLIAAYWTWPGSEVELNAPVLTWMTRGEGNKEIKRGGQGEWEKQSDRQTKHYGGENTQSSLHFHFSSSVLAAHELKECTAGQPAAHLDSAPLPSASSAGPSLLVLNPTSQHVHLSPMPTPILSIIRGEYLSTLFSSTDYGVLLSLTVMFCQGAIWMRERKQYF